MPRIRARLAELWREPIGPATYRRLTVAALVLLGAIIVTGAAVRLTGSGMGCPTWPSCEDGSLVPRGATGGHGWIEFLNRVFTGAVSVAVALAVLGARRRAPRRDDLVRWSWGLVAGVLAQALLGGLVVVLHVAPIAVAGHYLLSAVLVWNGVMLHHRASQPDDELHLPRRALATPDLLRWSRALVVVAGLVLVSGTFVTGSGPHGGDEAADRLHFAVSSVARVHSLLVWAFLVVIVVVVRQVDRGDADPSVVGRARVLAGLVLAQGALGYVQYFAGVPEVMVLAHVLGSVVVWIAALQVHLALTTAPLVAGAPGSTPRPVEPAPLPG